MRIRFPLVVAPLFVVGCGLAPGLPDLDVLYELEAAARDASRNPIVLTPGILGSRLQDDRRTR